MFEFERLLAALPELLKGAIVTVELTLAATALALILGSAIAILRVAGGPIGAVLTKTYVSIMRGTPALVQLFVVFFGLPLMGLGGEPFLAATLALGLNSAAYVSEILRSAFQEVSTGQREAATVVGMSKAQIWRRVILPQSFYMSLPPLTNEFTILLKTTPLASVVAVSELTYSGQLIISRTFQPTEVMLGITIIYIAIVLVFTRITRRAERRYLAKIYG